MSDSTSSNNVFVELMTSLGLLVLFAWIVKELVDFGHSVIETGNGELLATAFTGLVTVSVFVAGKLFEQQKETTRQLRQRKVEVYEELLKFLFEMMGRHGSNSVTEKEIKEFGQRFHHQLVLWGTDQIVIDYTEFRERASAEGYEALLGLERLLLSVRKDLGHKNKGLSEDHRILRVFLTDIERIMPSSVTK